MKDLSYSISNEVAEKMLEISSEGNEDFGLVGYSEGVLADNYLFKNWSSEKGAGITIGRKHKPRKWIIIKEVCQGDWSSELLAVETDKQKEVEDFAKNYELEEV